MEKTFDCVKLHFNTPLHLSRGREQYDEGTTMLHSDSLIAALFTAACQLGANPEEVLSMFDNIRISSAFPFHGNEYFFPKPMVQLPFDLLDSEKLNQSKTKKKIRFIGKSWFEKLLDNFDDNIQKNKHIHHTAFLTDQSIGTIFKTDVVQRVTIAPDYSEDARPFYIERLHFGNISGLFVLVESSDVYARNLFQGAFRLLGDLGIGTDRSVGNGFFTPTFESLTIKLPDAAAYQCALGLYLPDETELDEPFLIDSSWNLVKRGGFISGAENIDHFTLRKKSVYMFDVGSVFPNRLLKGKRVDLQPFGYDIKHSVWREGRPIFLPIIIRNTH
jgi:CRISPR-associated protein Csm4